MYSLLHLNHMLRFCCDFVFNSPEVAARGANQFKMLIRPVRDAMPTFFCLPTIGIY